MCSLDPQHPQELAKKCRSPGPTPNLLNPKFWSCSPSALEFGNHHCPYHIKISQPFAPGQRSLWALDPHSKPPCKTPPFLMSTRGLSSTHSVCRLLLPSCLTRRNPIDCSPPGSSVYGILQARILDWIAVSFSRGSSWPRDRTHISCTGRRIPYH